MILQYLTYSLVSYNHLSGFQFVAWSYFIYIYIVMITTQLLESLILLTRSVKVWFNIAFRNIHMTSHTTHDSIQL